MATATAKIAITGEDRTKKAFNSVQNSLGNLNKSFGSLKAGLGAVMGVAGVGAFISQMTSTADKIGKVSAKLGISTDALQKFRFGAEQSGVSASTFDMAIQRMTRRVSEAREGTGEAKKALKEMGIALRDSSGKAKTTEQIFYEVADRMKGMESQSDRVRLAFKLFDSEGVALVNMMQQGSGAIKGYGDELERYGGIIDHRAIKASEKFGDALNRLSKSSAIIFTPLIIGLNRVMETFTKWIDYFQGIAPADPFKLANKSSEELTKRVKHLNRLGEKAFELQKKVISKGDEELNLWDKIVGNKQQSVELQETIGSSISEIVAIEGELARRGELNTKQKKTQTKWMGISLEQQKQYSEDLSDQIGSSKNLLKLQKSQKAEHDKLLKVIEGELDEFLKQEQILYETSKTWTATIQGIDGSLHKVRGLTKAQAETLVKANKLARAQELYEVAVKKSVKAQKGVTDEIELQKKKVEEQNSQQKKLMGWVGSFSNTFSAIIKSIKFKIDDVTGKITMAGFSWQALGLNILMSSPKIQKSMKMLFGFVDRAVEGLIPGLEDTSKQAEEMARRAREIEAEVESMTSSISNYALQVRNSNSEMLALAQIEKTYQDRVKKAQELDATHLIYLAGVEKTMAILGYRVGVLRNATQAFAQSVTQFLDAVSTEGFTPVQKQLFAILKGFERGTKKAFTDLIDASDKIIAETPIAPQKMKDAFIEILASMKKQVAGQRGEAIKDITARYGITEQDVTPLLGMYEEINKLLSKGGIGKYTGEAIRRIVEKYVPVLDAGITALDSQITAYNEAVSTKVKAETDMATALKGLTVIIKDTIRTEFEAGKSKADLKIDLDALSATFSSLGVDINELKSFINTLKKVEPSGALGGLVKRYPYGGTIQGPSHTGGGVNANLEGGEYVMRKSAVDRYGSAFMHAVNTGRLGSGNQQPIQVNIYDGTGQQISEYDSALRVEINQRANRYHEFPAMAM